MSFDGFASTPEPPYYAVIFTSTQTAETEGYAEMAARMGELAQTMPGFLGMESTRGADGLGITVSYWRNRADITNWRNHAEHRVAQNIGMSKWYAHYELRIACVERAYGGPR